MLYCHCYIPSFPAQAFTEHSSKYLLPGLNGNEALCCHVLMGMKPVASH